MKTDKHWTEMTQTEIEEFFDHAQKRFAFWLVVLGLVAVVLIVAFKGTP